MRFETRIFSDLRDPACMSHAYQGYDGMPIISRQTLLNDALRSIYPQLSNPDEDKMV